jgi:hypothetical protein
MVRVIDLNSFLKTWRKSKDSFAFCFVTAVPSPGPTLGPGINLNQAATASLPHLLTNGSTSAIQQHQQLLSAMQQPQLVTPQSSLVTATAQPNSAPSHQPTQRLSHHQQHNHHYSVTFHILGSKGFNTQNCWVFGLHPSSNIPKNIILLYIAFPVFRVSKQDCRICNVSHKYKHTCIAQLKFSHKQTQWLHIRLFKNTSTCIHQQCQLILFT